MVPIDQAISEVLQIRRRSGAPKRYMESFTNRHRRFHEAFPGRTTAEITGKALDEWLAGLPVAALTRDHFRQDVRTLFSF